MSKIWTYSLVSIAATLYGAAVLAHPKLQSAEPAVGGTSAPPKQIRIIFNEAVIPRFSGIELRDPSGKLVATGKSETDPADKKVLVVPVKQELVPDDYTVEWHAVSDNTHRVNGSYSFSVSR